MIFNLASSFKVSDSDDGQVHKDLPTYEVDYVPIGVGACRYP